MDKLKQVNGITVKEKGENRKEIINASALSVRVATSEDARAVCELFRKVFNEEMSLEHWRWKYDRNHSRGVVVYRDKKLVAHYGGVGSEIMLEGEKNTAIQITDLMVDPQERNAVRSNSPFYLSAKKFLGSFVGNENPFLLAYGFPSERAMVLSEKLGLFSNVGHMWEVQWDRISHEDTVKSKIISLDNNNFPHYEKKINSLWQKFSKLFSSNIICRKDADYFRWRFLEHPTKKYSINLVLNGLTRAPKALLVLQHDENKTMLMDLLGVSLGLEEIIGTAKAIAARQGSSNLITWCSDPFIDLFSVHSAQQKSLPIIIPANTGSDGPALETQKNKWWLMPGDTDYL